MARTSRLKTKRAQIGYIFGLWCFCVQGSLATDRLSSGRLPSKRLSSKHSVTEPLASERWQTVVLPDTNYNTPNELPALADYHSTISQGLTIALTNADFDVLDLHYLGLPNCIIEDCSTLTDHAIQQAAIRSGKNVNLALLYQLNAFKQRQSSSQKWYFSLSGRLLDLQSGAQQDAFTVDNWVNSPSKNCIGDCLAMWLKQNLALLAQDLGMVLSEKLDSLPRRFHYRLNLNNFEHTELQQIDHYLKSLDGYIADLLLTDSRSKNQVPDQALHLSSEQSTSQDTNRNQSTDRAYQYISELTASELSAKLEDFNQLHSLRLKFEYDNTQRQFTLMPLLVTAPWATFSQFMTDLFANSPQNEPAPELSNNTSTHTDMTPQQLVDITQSQQAEAGDDKYEEKEKEKEQQKEILRESHIWQQAQDINSQDSYQQYLSIWPQGQHFIQAKALIQEFQDDENIWRQTSTNKTSQAYQQYLSLKPSGKYTKQAKQQLAWLRKQRQQEQKKRENKTLADDYYHQQQNYPEALYYYQQAAKLGDVWSQYLLGKMYEDGKGIELNMRQAANWYVQAAKQGHSKAQATLGFMYSKGNGVNQDYSQAIHWYRKAAVQGHISAQYNLAYLYSRGTGVAKDYQQAAYWLQKSAIQGDDDAQNSLGKLYERGLGVNKDLVKAKSLYQQAAAQGNQIAQLNLRMLNNAR